MARPTLAALRARLPWRRTPEPTIQPITLEVLVRRLPTGRYEATWGPWLRVEGDSAAAVLQLLGQQLATKDVATAILERIVVPAGGG